MPNPSLPVVFAVAALAVSGCVVPTAVGLRTDGRRPLHPGPMELGLGLTEGVSTSGMTLLPLVSPSFALHSELVSVAATVHLVPVGLTQVVPILSGEGRIRIWEDGPEGMGVALLLGAGIPLAFNWGVDTGVVVSTPRRAGFRGYAGTRFNTAFPLQESVTLHFPEDGFIVRGDVVFPLETTLFGTAAAGVTWSSPSGWNASLEFAAMLGLARGNLGVDDAPWFGLSVNVGRVLGKSGG